MTGERCQALSNRGMFNTHLDRRPTSACLKLSKLYELVIYRKVSLTDECSIEKNRRLGRAIL